MAIIIFIYIYTAYMEMIWLKRNKRYKIIAACMIAACLMQFNSPIIYAADTEAAAVGEKIEMLAENQSVKGIASNVKTVNITIKAANNSDISKSVQQALDTARDKATDSIPYRVIIPKGTYKLKTPLEIYSNTQLYAVGAHIIKESLSGGMLRTAMPKFGYELKGYSGYRNITVEGGTWDGNAESKTYGEGKCSAFSNFRFAHVTNLTLKNISITNNVGSHHLELGGADEVNITGCTFQGYKSGGVDGGKEAIQIDVMHSSDVFIGFPSFDDTPCRNISITNNRFINVNRGVGNHTAVMGVYFDKIMVKDNYFQDINQQAMICLNWRNSDITSNTMKNVGSGVDFKSMESGLYYTPKSGSAVVASNVNTTISDNNVSVRSNAEKVLPYVFGIRAWGNVVKSSDNPNKLPVGKYSVEGVTISNNKITSYGKIDGGISGKIMNNCTVKGNTVNFADSKNNKNGRGIYLKQSSKNKIENNICKSIIGTGSNGIHLVEESNNNTIKGNTVSSCSGSGISINSSSENNTITGGAVKGNSNNGISLNSVSGNKVWQISGITNNGGYGIAVAAASKKNKIDNVTVYSGKKSGIMISGSSSDNTVSNAVSNNNSDSGITISDSKKNSVTSSTFSSNKSYGISITGKSSSNSSKLCNSNNNTKGQIDISKSSSGNTIDLLSTTTAVKGIQPSIPKGLSVKSVTAKSITLKWGKSSNASGYIIYRSTDSGNYSKYKTITKSTELTFTDKNLTTNKKYSYRIVSYYKSNNNTIISSYEKTLSAKPTITAPKLNASSTKNSVKLTWNKVSEADGYIVYKFNSKTKQYNKLTTINNAKVLIIKNSGLSANTKYTYKVSAYVKNGKSNIEGSSSNIVVISTKSK